MFEQYLHSEKVRIDKQLTTFLATLPKQTEYAALQAQCKDGKRIRGALVKLGYELFQDNNSQLLINAQIAYEIVQTALLSHDDIIDKSSFRRGKPSLYKILGGNHYGISQTICLGDVGFFMSIELIARSKFPGELNNKAILYFAQTIQQTIHGQIMDINLSGQLAVTRKDIITIALLKTASYSITGPLCLGATFASATPRQIKAIKQFGDLLGITYQIHDDILGIFGEKKIIGKPTNSDICEGKATLLLWYALKKADAEQRDIIVHLYGKKNISSKEQELIKDLLIATGAKAYAQKQCEYYTAKAQALTPTITKDSYMQDLLYSLTAFLLKRIK